MAVYLDLAVILNFLVDFLLLLGTNRLLGFPPEARRGAAAAGVGALYAGACLLPGFAFLGNFLWRLVCLGIMGALAFGTTREAAQRTAVFVLLSMALGGAALGLGGFLGILGAAAGVCLICLLGFRGRRLGQQFVPVELCCEGIRVRLTALRDTGNGLRDPITGERVLVIGPRAAVRLTGLREAQLRAPVETVAAKALPGLRLIPYRAVGREGGMLLAMRVPKVRIGSWQGAAVVAFAPEGLDGTYEALIGGTA